MSGDAVNVQRQQTTESITARNTVAGVKGFATESSRELVLHVVLGEDVSGATGSHADAEAVCANNKISISG